jgi:hypothetical protein
MEVMHFSPASRRFESGNLRCHSPIQSSVQLCRQVERSHEADLLPQSSTPCSPQLPHKPSSIRFKELVGALHFSTPHRPLQSPHRTTLGHVRLQTRSVVSVQRCCPGQTAISTDGSLMNGSMQRVVCLFLDINAFKL